MPTVVIPEKLEPIVNYVVQGTEHQFTFKFFVTRTEDLFVYVNNKLVDKNNYTVMGFDNPNGGYVDIIKNLQPLVKGDQVTLFRFTLPEQITEFIRLGDFTAVSVNAEFNRIYALMQELRRDAITKYDDDEQEVEGHIHFEDITFEYTGKPNSPVMLKDYKAAIVSINEKVAKNTSDIQALGVKLGANLPILPWKKGGKAVNPFQRYMFLTDPAALAYGFTYNALLASKSSPVIMGDTPAGDKNWHQWDVSVGDLTDAYKKLSPIKNPFLYGVVSAMVGDTTATLQLFLDSLSDGSIVDFGNLPIQIESVTLSKNNIVIMNLPNFRSTTPVGMGWIVTGNNCTFMNYQGKIDLSVTDISCGHILFDAVEKGQVTGGSAEGGARSGAWNKDANMVGVSKSNNVTITNFEMKQSFYQEQIQLDSSTNCKVLWCNSDAANTAYSAVASTDIDGSVPTGNHQVDFNNFNNYKTSIVTMNTKRNLVRWNTLIGSVEEQGVNCGHNGQSADETTVAYNVIKSVAGDAVAFADSANCRAIDNDIDTCHSAYSMIGLSDNLHISHPTSKVKNMTGSAIRISSATSLSLKVRGFDAENMVGHGVEGNGKPASIDVDGMKIKNLDSAASPGGRCMIYVEDGTNLGKLKLTNYELVNGANNANRVVKINSNSQSDTTFELTNGDALGQSSAALFQAVGAQPANRLIRDNKLSKDVGNFSVVTIPGGSLEITIANANQTPYAPPIIIYADKDAVTRQTYVKSWGSGMFVLATVLIGTNAEVGYECR